MDTLPLEPIDLIAVDPARNIHRRWSLVAMRDLFGEILVETSWGRIGARGHQLTKCFPDEAAAMRYTRSLLSRRRSAEQRLGVGYVERAGVGGLPIQDHPPRRCDGGAPSRA